MEETAKQDKKQNYDWLKQYQFQKGQSGNPNGAPRGKRLKTFALEMIEKMSDEDKADFLKTIDPKIVWEMAEGKAKQEIDAEVKGNLIVNVVNYGQSNNDTASVQSESLPATPNESDGLGGKESDNSLE